MIEAKTCDKVLSFVNTKVKNVLVTPIFTFPSASGLGPTACKLFYSQSLELCHIFQLSSVLVHICTEYLNKLMKFELAGVGVHR